MSRILNNNNTEKTFQATRDSNIDLLRILACFFVIGIHVSGTGLMKGRNYEIGSFNWLVCVIFDSFARWSVPVFVMISGCCLLNSNKIVSLSKLFGKYISRIFVALIVWSLFYAWVFHLPIMPLGSQGGHMWYLPMILGVYLTIPILQSLSTKILKYLVVIWFVFLCCAFFNNITNGNFHILDIEHNFFLDYVGYFVLGHLLYQQKRTLTTNIFIYLSGIVSFIVTIFCTYWFTRQGNELNEIFFGYLSPNVLFMSMAIFVFATDKKRSISIPFINSFIISIFACTFGIYLAQMFFLAQIYSRVLRFVPNPIFYIPLVCLLTFGFGYIIVYLIRKIPVISNYIV